jgi:hypothetical protein
MSNKKYVIDDRRPSLLPKIGSAVIAIGSLASVAAVASPGIMPLIHEAAATSDTDAFGNPITAQSDVQVQAEAAAPTLPSEQIAADSGTYSSSASATFSASNVEAVAEVIPQATASVSESPVPTATSTPVATPTPEPSATATPTPEPTATATPTSEVTTVVDSLAPVAPVAGNTSSPTPFSGGTSTSAGTSTSTGTTTTVTSPTTGTSTGNVSSPTPAGGSHSDDDHYEDHDDDHDDD